MGELPMKRKIILCILLIAFSLTGCINSYDYTEVETDSVAEYMAGLLLKYDSEYNQALAPIEKVIKEDIGEVLKEQEQQNEPQTESTEKTAIQNDKNQTEQPGQPEQIYTISDVIGVKDFELQYQTYRLTDAYPEDTDTAYFTLTPRNGYQLLITEFNLKNTTKKQKTLNLTKDKIQYQLVVNEGTEYKPLLTLLENDLQYINIILEKQEETKVLLIYEVPTEVEITNMNLYISKDSKSVTVKVK